MCDPLVSVIVPVFNAQKYLDACFESLRNQTYKNIEIIFVDDCSRDDSFKKLIEFSKKDSRVVVVQTEKNMGVSAARNKGLDIARGILIGFCDSDDTCDVELFEEMVKCFTDSNIDIVCCGLKRKDESGKVLMELWDCKKNTLMNSEETLKYWLIGKYIGNSVYTKLFRKELWMDVRFPVGQIFEEAYVIPKLVDRAQNVVHSGCVGYNYYVREGSYTLQSLNTNKLVVYERERYIREFLSEKYPGLRDALTCFEIRNHLSLMTAAEMSRGICSKEIYDEVKKQFNAIFFCGLCNKYISLKDKLNMIEIKLKVFYWRKRFEKYIKKIINKKVST